MKHKVFYLLALLMATGIFSTTACSEQAAPKMEASSMTELIKTDVKLGTGAFNEIQNHLDELPADKNAPVVLYCRSGPMSVRAATTLAGLGYTRIYSLNGGFNAWSAAGLPMAPNP